MMISMPMMLIAAAGKQFKDVDSPNQVPQRFLLNCQAQNSKVQLKLSIEILHLHQQTYISLTVSVR